MLSTVPSVIRSCWARFSFLGSYGVSKEPPDPFLHKFHALGSGFCLLSLSYFSYNFSKHLPYSISPKWEIIVPLFERNWNEVICPLKWQLQAEMFSVEQRSSELKPASLFHEWSPPVSLLLLTFPLPPLISHYMRFFFFFQRWALACSECFRCQTSCFPLSNMTLSATHCISEWHHGIQLRTAGEKRLWEPGGPLLAPLPSSELFGDDEQEPCLWMCVSIALKAGVGKLGLEDPIL